MQALALAMEMKALSDEISAKLINHILFKEKFEGKDGKDGWSCLNSNIVTEKELRDLLMAHSATKLAQHNNTSVPSFSEYGSIKVCGEFEKALFGRPAKPSSSDI